MSYRLFKLCAVIFMLVLSACGNDPNPPATEVPPTDTPMPAIPTDTPTPEPTATLVPTATLTPVPTPAEPPTPTLTPTPDVLPVLSTVLGNVNLRLGPGEEFATDGLLLVGETFDVIGRNADSTWWQIDAGFGLRWAAAEVTEIEGPVEVVPVVEVEVASIPTAPPPTPTSTETPLPTATITFCETITVDAPTAGELFLLTEVEVRWRCEGVIPEGHSFEVRLAVSGQEPIGAHNAVNDAANIQYDGETYSLSVLLDAAAGFAGNNQDYDLAVALVQISPSYQDAGVVSAPVTIRYE